MYSLTASSSSVPGVWLSCVDSVVGSTPFFSRMDPWKASMKRLGSSAFGSRNGSMPAFLSFLHSLRKSSQFAGGSS